MPRMPPGAPDVIDQLLDRQSLIVGQRGSVDRRKNDLFGSRLDEGPREVFLKNTPAGSGRSRLEHGPDALIRMRRRDGAQRFQNGGGMMRKIVVDGNTAYGSPQLEPAPDALERGQTAPHRVRRQPNR